MKKNIKYILISVIGISSFTMFFLFSFLIVPNLQSTIAQNSTDREKQFQVENISVYIDYSGVKENEMFQNLNLTNYQTTAYHAVLNCCDIKIKDYGWGIFVEEINDVGIGWIYWINNDIPPSIPSNYFYLMDNDTVNWKYVGR
ncbi:MAG: hypothetical protein ACFFA0_04535 [Promethearchaeota archaeon]